MSDENKEVTPIEKKEPVNLTLQTIKSKGGVLDNKPVRKQIVWRQSFQNEKGEVEVEEYDAYVFVRRQSYKVFSSFIKNSQNHDENIVLISECIAKDETGKENLFTLEDADNLETNLVFALITAINEVNIKKK